MAKAITGRNRIWGLWLSFLLLKVENSGHLLIKPLADAAESNIVVLITRVPIQVQGKRPGVRTIIPIPAAEQNTVIDSIPRPQSEHICLRGGRVEAL